MTQIAHYTHKTACPYSTGVETEEFVKELLRIVFVIRKAAAVPSVFVTPRNIVVQKLDRLSVQPGIPADLLQRAVRVFDLSLIHI